MSNRLEAKSLKDGERARAAPTCGAVDKIRLVAIELGQLRREIGRDKVHIGRARHVAAGVLDGRADIHHHDIAPVGKKLPCTRGIDVFHTRSVRRRGGRRRTGAECDVDRSWAQASDSATPRLRANARVSPRASAPDRREVIRVSDMMRA